MPPGRRGRPAGSTARPTTPQQRLSFGPNSTNKITKPSTLAQDAAKKLSPTQKSRLSKEIVNVDDTPTKSPLPSEDASPGTQDESRTLPIRRNEKSKIEEGRDKKEVEALKVTEAQIKKYWMRKEEVRIAPRVHQQGMSVHEKVLREWDLSNQYGVRAPSLLLPLRPSFDLIEEILLGGMLLTCTL